MVEGSLLPVLTAQYSGFVAGDDASALDTPVMLTTSASSTSPAGANYEISFVKGTLTVRAKEPALLTLNGERGKPGSFFVFEAQGFVPGEDLQIEIEGRRVLVLTADTNGTLSFVIYFGPEAPARTYSISASSVAQAIQPGAAARQAQTSILIDPAAALLP